MSDRIACRKGRALVLSVIALLLVLVGCTAGGGGHDESISAPTQPFTADAAVASPDGTLHFELGTDDDGRPRYRIVRVVSGNDIEVVNDSTLGLETSLGSIARGLTVTTVSSLQTVTDRFELPTGKARIGTETWTAQTVTFGNRAAGDPAGDPEGPSGVELMIDVAVADTGAAFRYRLAVADAGGGAAPDPTHTVSIDWERTTFRVATDSLAWLQPYDAPGPYTPAYEAPRRAEQRVGDLLTARNGTALPALFETPVGGWLFVAEAGLGPGQRGSHLGPQVHDGEFVFEGPAPGEGAGIGVTEVRSVLPWVSPWRVFITSTELGDIVASDFVRHLSGPTAAEAANLSWIRAGRASWSWWSDHDSSRDPVAMQEFIDLASEMGWEYSLVDANWTSFDDAELANLLDHASSRGVGLWLWYNSGGPHNEVTEAPRDRMYDTELRRAEFARIAELGVVGVKVDFFHSDKPMAIDLYRGILTDALDAGLMVNFHGSTVPRGWSREFPNLMTMEAVRGAEIYTFDPGYAAVAPRQNTELPFTRNVVGSMDYTPVILGESAHRRTSNGHELALAVLFESGVQHFVDTPEVYFSQPPEVLDLLRAVPAAWDETRLLDGYPGSHVVLARRSGDTWWIAAIEGTGDARRLEVDIASLDAVGAAMVVACDDPRSSVGGVADEESAVGTGAASDESGELPDRAPWEVRTGEAPDSLGLDLIAYGGCLVRIG